MPSVDTEQAAGASAPSSTTAKDTHDDFPREHLANGSPQSSASKFDEDPKSPDSLYHDADSSIVRQLHSDDQAELLGAIDKLRKEHIDKTISIPQIIVCGDQSSGKSSVLEAIANVPFPISSGTTTRFATEVILRQASQPGLQVSIIPAKDRTEEQRERLAKFEPGFKVTGPDDFGRLIEAAGKYLQDMEPERRFWSDWLRAELSGPNQPHLTLVDLPGIIQTETATGTLVGDKARIKQLVDERLREPRTIVLAVVNALNDIDNQEIIELVGLAANAKTRTLGVLTKPDCVPPNSDLEKTMVNLVANKKLPLGLGWHVLRNLPHEAKDRSPGVRDETEKDFFEHGTWSIVQKADVGVANLTKKLGKHLFDCIASDLPQLILEMREMADQRKATLERLGSTRDTIADQRTYLANIMLKAKRLIKEGWKGTYNDDEGPVPFFDGALEKQLRYQITTNSERFAKELRLNGHQYFVHAGGMENAPHER
jgi:GTP-binding protein EngB required for normal cell division